MDDKPEQAPEQKPEQSEQEIAANQQAHRESMARVAIYDALAAAKIARPTERGELARHWAVIITDLEKVVAYAHTYTLPVLIKKDPA